MLKQFISNKINVARKNPFFFCEFQLITNLLLTRNFYTSWSTRFISLKLCVGFSIFDSVSFLLKFIFCLTKSMDSLTLKRHNSFQNKNDRKGTLRTLTFKLQQEVWKFSDIYLSWNSPKTDLGTNFLNLEHRGFEYATFSQ